LGDLIRLRRKRVSSFPSFIKKSGCPGFPPDFPTGFPKEKWVSWLPHYRCPGFPTIMGRVLSFAALAVFVFGKEGHVLGGTQEPVSGSWLRRDGSHLLRWVKI